MTPLEAAAIPSRGEVRRLGERLCGGNPRTTDRSFLHRFRTYCCSNLIELFGDVRTIVEGLPGGLSCRVKRLDSIIRKLQRGTVSDLSRMDDILAFRIVVCTPEEQRTTIDLLLGQWGEATRVKDYVAEPQASGYRAVHVFFHQFLQAGNRGEPMKFPLEVQVRTHYQHLWATESERFGEQVKAGGGPDEVRSYLLALGENIAAHEEEAPDEEQVDEVPIINGPQLFVVDYDKGRGRAERDSLGQDLPAALDKLDYLEELHGASHESVLLGIDADGEKLRLTHLRYFVADGVPTLPAHIIQDLNRPL